MIISRANSYSFIYQSLQQMPRLFSPSFCAAGNDRPCVTVGRIERRVAASLSVVVPRQAAGVGGGREGRGTGLKLESENLRVVWEILQYAMWGVRWWKSFSWMFYKCSTGRWDNPAGAMLPKQGGELIRKHSTKPFPRPDAPHCSMWLLALKHNCYM